MIFMIVEVPEGVKVEVKGSEVTATGSLGSNRRSYNDVLLSVKLDGSKIEIEPTRIKALSGKAERAVNALAKELKNDMEGTLKHFERRMTIVFAHFPMTVEVKGSDFIIRNMLGQRDFRKADIIGATKIEVKGQNVRVYGPRLDDVAQTAANIRNATKTTHRDIRIFQDGIYYAADVQ